MPFDGITEADKYTRANFARILREADESQRIDCELHSADHTKHCALGMLEYVLNGNEVPPMMDNSVINKIVDVLGMTDMKAVFRMNDREKVFERGAFEHSWKEIADYIESGEQ